MTLSPKEVDDLLSEGFAKPPQGFERSVMARIEAEAIAVSTPLYLHILRGLALVTGVGVGVAQAMRILFGMYFVGAFS